MIMKSIDQVTICIKTVRMLILSDYYMSFVYNFSAHFHPCAGKNLPVTFLFVFLNCSFHFCRSLRTIGHAYNVTNDMCVRLCALQSYSHNNVMNSFEPYIECICAKVTLMHYRPR